jgi:hypothetical protein
MAVPKLSRRRLVSFLPFGLLGFAGCASGQSSYIPRLETDAEFQGAMPDYQLTSAIIGRPVVRSPGFALLLYDQSEAPQTVFSVFLSQFDESGLRAVDLYIRGFSREFDSWRLRFPGCSINECANLESGLRVDAISQQEHDRYDASLFVRHRIAEATLSGVSYKAEVIVGYDYQSRLITYWVQTNRVAINDAEREWVTRNARSRRSHPVDVYQYTNNLALGLSGFYDNGPSISGNNAKGL